MKRDLKKWLSSPEFVDFVNNSLDFEEDYTDQMKCENLLMKSDYIASNGIPSDDLVQFIWCSAQKQFLKDILDDIDDAVDKIFNGKSKVKNDKARIVAEEESLKTWLYNKYKYLQRKNGK